LQGTAESLATTMTAQLQETIELQGTANGNLAFSPILVDIDTPIADYTFPNLLVSIRKNRTNYSGPAIQVRRSSDGATLDIGFDANGDLDETALLNHVGSDDGFVTIWYDQSGNGNDATQTTASNQPKIVEAGTVIKRSKKPALDFSSGNDFFEHNTLTVRTIVAGVEAKGNPNNPENLINGLASADAPNGIQFRHLSFQGGYTKQSFEFGDTGKLWVNQDNTASNGSSPHIVSAVDTTPEQIISISGPDLNRYWLGTMQELIFYPDNQEKIIRSIEDLMNNYYGIF